MPNLFIIIGEHGTGKSSLIRCLTGVGQRSLIPQLQIGHVSRNLYVQIRSLQEARIDSATFIAEMGQLSPYDILLSLRVNSLGAYPDGVRYIEDFIQTPGWSVSRIVRLGQTPLNRPLPAGVPAPMAMNPAGHTPKNKVAADVRNAWNWI